ncbi:hypothetical protein [Clostridium sp.]|uniref:hypothetical protein n=1 Tax=Clostridium sp. TaxID=1506 RepID=UPI0026387DA9|nr:hypothetical protein [Clostridium sp.]
MTTLRNLLEEYRNITLKLIEKTKNGEDLTNLIKQSNNILDEVRKVEYNKNELEEILIELNIENLENELRLTIKQEMVKIKKKIENIRTIKIARQTYRNSHREIKLFIGRA